MAARPFNPIIPGFAPDPSVCLIGDTYFLVNSSFHLFPGLPIFASKDLVSWKHIGNAINRPSQLSLSGASTFLVPWPDGSTMVATGGLYAPTIRHHQGTTYIVCTNVVHNSHRHADGESPHNFIIHTTDIWSNKWSDPVWYSFSGIDPSILFDDDGKIYLQGSKTPDFQIYNFEIDLETGKTSEEKLIWTGWDKRYTEGPHIYKKDGWYYLLCAEGGTFNFHMLSMARSKSIWGPYETCDRNPIFTAHGTENYVQNTGHADMFQGSDGRWWIVMLGVRLRDGRYTMGRESFLSAVEWRDGEWPVVAKVSTEVEGRDLPAVGPVIEVAEGVDWVYLRDSGVDMMRISGRDVKVVASLNDLTTPTEHVSFVGKRQRLLDGQALVVLERPASLAGAALKAGICLFKDEHRFVSLSFDFASSSVLFEAANPAKGLKKSGSSATGGAGSGSDSLQFRISYNEMGYEFAFAPQESQSFTVLGLVDTLDLSGFDFTGPLVGVYAVGDGHEVAFREFHVD